MEFVTEPLKNSDEVKCGSDWSNLPRDIAESILKRLCLQDFLQFGEVCKSWETIVANAIATKHCLPATQAQLPLMIASRNEDIRVFSLPTKKFIQPRRPIFTENQYCIGSIGGWLIMFDSPVWSHVGDNVPSDPNSSPFFFFNTLSNVRINLPSALNIPQQVISHSCPVDKMVASSSPSSKDCFIAGILNDFQLLAFCKIEDKSWTIIESETANISIVDIEILNKKLFVLVRQARERFIKVYDLQNPNSTIVEALPLPAYHPVMPLNRIMGNISHVSNVSVYFLRKVFFIILKISLHGISGWAC
ncbi:hypothetical protein L6164_028850 [Bauhinia variegata]|uniref:Uncharacterized protein n=1 Tax=Bauhinia variegata TaxID=167791 RepID=A0ACB9L6X8_BAUVA|nr:hypothetical protein L6164_028850 [Bauhinia variegata]